MGVGSHGDAAAGMAAVDFIGNAVANDCTQNFINVGHSTAAAASISGAGGGFMQQQDSFGASVQMLARSYEGGAAARVGMNGGGGSGYGGFAYSSAMGVVGHGGIVSAGLGGQQINGGQQFLKPSTTAGDDQPTATQ